MSVEQERQWITGEEYDRERRRLLEQGIPEDAPESQALTRRVIERDEYLFDRYGKPYPETHRGQWVAVSLDGEVIFRDTAGEVVWAATEAFGPGNFASRKLAEFPGHRFAF
jgi:hypothetical protein